MYQDFQNSTNGFNYKLIETDLYPSTGLLQCIASMTIEKISTPLPPPALTHDTCAFKHTYDPLTYLWYFFLKPSTDILYTARILTIDTIALFSCIAYYQCGIAV